MVTIGFSKINHFWLEMTPNGRCDYTRTINTSWCATDHRRKKNDAEEKRVLTRFFGVGQWDPHRKKKHQYKYPLNNDPNKLVVTKTFIARFCYRKSHWNNTEKISDWHILIGWFQLLTLSAVTLSPCVIINGSYKNTSKFKWINMVNSAINNVIIVVFLFVCLLRFCFNRVKSELNSSILLSDMKELVLLLVFGLVSKPVKGNYSWRKAKSKAEAVRRGSVYWLYCKVQTGNLSTSAEINWKSSDRYCCLKRLTFNKSGF